MPQVTTWSFLGNTGTPPMIATFRNGGKLSASGELHTLIAYTISGRTVVYRTHQEPFHTYEHVDVIGATTEDTMMNTSQ